MKKDSGWGNDPVRSGLLAQKVGANNAKAVQDYINQHARNGDLYRDWHDKDLRRYYTSSFATGGYTGSWPGREGRLAMLHQKELILNQEDTKNTLAALKISNAIINSLGLAQDSVNRINSGKIPTMDNNTNNETSVVINADFPNVSDALEIKNALNNLVNRASQLASQNRRTY